MGKTSTSNGKKRKASAIDSSSPNVSEGEEENLPDLNAKELYQKNKKLEKLVRELERDARKNKKRKKGKRGSRSKGATVEDEAANAKEKSYQEAAFKIVLNASPFLTDSDDIFSIEIPPDVVENYKLETSEKLDDAEKKSLQNLFAEVADYIESKHPGYRKMKSGAEKTKIKKQYTTEWNEWGKQSFRLQDVLEQVPSSIRPQFLVTTNYQVCKRIPTTRSPIIGYIRKHKEQIFAEHDLKDPEVVAGLLENFSFAHGDDVSIAEGLFLGEPLTRILRGLIYGEAAITQVPPYTTTKRTNGKKYIKNLSVGIFAFAIIIGVHLLDIHNLPLPKVNVKKQKAGKNDKQKKASTSTSAAQQAVKKTAKSFDAESYEDMYYDLKKSFDNLQEAKKSQEKVEENIKIVEKRVFSQSRQAEEDEDSDDEGETEDMFAAAFGIGEEEEGGKKNGAKEANQNSGGNKSPVDRAAAKDPKQQNAKKGAENSKGKGKDQAEEEEEESEQEGEEGEEEQEEESRKSNRRRKKGKGEDQED
ncbi:hypothetical protein JCM5350_004369 [Sporobolomyces pararoseus]